ncbi:MAG: UDP-N-acetylmuramyl pentapeptide synthase, partial [Candidatus Krumholzibacteriia bacterium]
AGGGQSVTCASVAEAAQWLTDNSQPNDFLLVKGSRSAAMETILPMLEKTFGSNPDIKTEA